MSNYVREKADWQNGDVVTEATLDRIEAGIATHTHTSSEITDGVALSTATPAAPTAAGTAGTANTAARGDHAHPMQVVVGYPVEGGQVDNAPAWINPLGYFGGITALDASRVPLSPLPIRRRMSILQLATRMQVTADAGTFSLAIYAPGSTGLPTGAPVWTSSQIVATTGGTKIVDLSGSPLTLDPALYWLGFGAKGFTSTRPQPGQSTLGAHWVPTIHGDPANAPGLVLKNSVYSETTGTWPTITTATDFQAFANSRSDFWYAFQAVAA